MTQPWGETACRDAVRPLNGPSCESRSGSQSGTGWYLHACICRSQQACIVCSTACLASHASCTWRGQQVCQERDIMMMDLPLHHACHRARHMYGGTVTAVAGCKWPRVLATKTHSGGMRAGICRACSWPVANPHRKDRTCASLNHISKSQYGKIITHARSNITPDPGGHRPVPL